MRMNPILKKELLLGSRSIKFPIAIMFYSGIMAVVALVILTASTSAFNGSIEFSALTMVFFILAIMQLVLICIIIPILTAGSIAGERERQTLDLLLTAPVSSLTIVLGKLFSSMCNVILFVISSLPAMAIAFLYGGIQWKFLFVFLVEILVTAFFCGSIGVWVASVFKKTILSIIMTMVIELAFFLGTLAAVGIIYAGKYTAMLAAMTNSTVSSGSMPTVQMGWFHSILLLNPATGFVDSLLHTYTGIGCMHEFLNTGVIGNSASGLIAMSEHWYIFSLIITLALGVLFIFLTVRHLDTMCKKDKFLQPVKKKK